MPTLPASGVSFTVKTNGQTLIVSAGVSYGTLTALLYSDAACTAAVTTPHTIGTDTTYYLPPDRAQNAYYISCKQPDGTELWGKSQHLGGITIEPVPTPFQVAADVRRRDLALLPSGALAETFPRQTTATGNNVTLTSGRLHMTAIDIPNASVISSISMMTGTTAVTGATHQWFALYNSALGLLAQTTNDTNAAWAQNTVKTLSFASPYTTTYGGRYYLGALVVGTVGTHVSHNTLAVLNTLPPVTNGYANTGLTDTAPATAAALTGVITTPYMYVS